MLPGEPGPPHPRTQPGTLSSGNCRVDFFKIKGSLLQDPYRDPHDPSIIRSTDNY